MATVNEQVTFRCPAPNCGYAIDSIGLNSVQLLVLRRTAKACPKCGHLAKFIEQAGLPDIQNNKQLSNGGASNENLTKNNKSDPRRDSKKQRAAHG